MQIYLFDEYTKEYLGEQKADKNPKETKIQGVFVPLIPANSTLIKPPTVKEGSVAVFENDKWIMKSDYRGQKVINPETEEIKEVDYIGELESGFYLYDAYINSEEYKEKQEKAEKLRILKLSMTPLDFINAIETLGVTYSDIKELCNTYEEVDKQLRFCNRVYRGNELINQFAAKFNVTSNQLDELFKTYGG